MPGRWNEMWLRTGQDITKWVKRRIQTCISRRDHFNCTQTCRREKGKAGNKKPLASRPKNVSNELTDHIPTHKSQSRNHIQTYNSTGGKRGIAVERLSGRRRPCLTVQWASSVYITWRNPTNGSEIVPCCQKFLLKGKKRAREWEKDLKEERERERGRRQGELVKRVGGRREKA